ncbi:MAG: putative ABC transporter permease [Eubacteriales bacterium]|nr:putative ABC transporter permease [Eubacteriales bacterium]
MDAVSEKYASELEQLGQETLDAAERLEQSIQEVYAQIPETENLETFGEMAEELRETAGMLAKASSQVFSVSDELSARCRDTRQQRRKRKLISAAPANGTIDLEEREGDHFARGLGIYKLLLILFIGSFAGVIVELLWCLIRNGYLESRSGLVYGPFNLLYGAGAVALTVCLYRFRNRSGWISFLGGMLVGTVVEYLCSWGQEMLFCSRSWDYSNMPFNLNGRVCLLYSVFWGVLGVLWIKDLYPRMAQLILKLPNKIGKILTIAATVFLILNGIVSLLAVDRWSERVAGEAPSNSLEALLDERFPDERMELVYANMDF